MTGPAVSVTREGMIAAADRMRQALDLVRKQRNEVNHSVDVLGITFGGEAASQYRIAMGNWSSNAQEIENALNEMIGIMDSNATQVGTAAAGALDDVSEGVSRMASTNPGLAGL